MSQEDKEVEVRFSYSCSSPWLCSATLNGCAAALPSPCTGIVTVCPLLAVTVAVATVTRVWPGTGVTDTASGLCTGTVLTTGCGGALPAGPASGAPSLSANRRRRVGLAVGELYLSYRLAGGEESPARTNTHRYMFNSCFIIPSFTNTPNANQNMPCKALQGKNFKNTDCFQR